MAERQGYNRRDFLKIVGAGAGIAAGGCARELPERFIPYVVQPDEVIPGVASWYSGACFECGGGCGVLVRTREGRAVKVEGNPHHPINQGKLCAHGQSTLQSLYDPDRVREPLVRDVGGAFATSDWPKAMAKVGAALAGASKAGKEVIVVTRPLQGSERALVEDFKTKIKNVSVIEYELLNRDSLDVATEELFGPGSRVSFDFSGAKYVCSVGADYLESWVSPVEFARQWAQGRKPTDGSPMSFVAHFEPRLSLTAANADLWQVHRPGAEVLILRALLREVVTLNGGNVLPTDALRYAQTLPKPTDADLGFPYSRIVEVAKGLVGAKGSLVVAGGAPVSGSSAVEASRLSLLLNMALGNMGKTVALSRQPNTPKAVSSYDQLVAALSDIAEGKRSPAVLMTVGVNLSYLLPSGANFSQAVRKIPFTVALSMNLDEGTSYANVVLPLSSSFESWLDAEPRPGVFNLSQPAMQPLYQTQSFGDTLISILSSSEVNAPLEKISSFYDFIRAQWRTRTGDADFESRWLTYVEQGGEWARAEKPMTQWQFQGRYAAALTAPAAVELPKPDTLSLLVHPTVRSFDGSAANRPWMQELPDPMVSAVWGSWVQIHPETAKRLGYTDGQVVQVRGKNGTIEAPLSVTDHIHPDLLAVPLGQGHEGLGRYAAGVGAHAMSLLDARPAGGYRSFVVTDVTLGRAMGTDKLVRLQFSDTEQGERGIARVISAGAATGLLGRAAKGHAAEAGAHGDTHASESPGHTSEAGHAEGHGAAEGEEHDRLALGPQPAPAMMYRQSDHPLYRWGMAIDLANCIGCAACVVACYAENNVPVVGKTICNEGREMSWLRIERYFDEKPANQPLKAFVPMLCQHCNNAPCEPVCPVYATYHTEEGLNSMVYNRCVGTRYCLNNCTYKVRRFNWYKYTYPEPLNWQLNPDVTVRELGVMEKCSFCIQRIREVQGNAKDEGRPVRDGEIQTACAATCPTDAITFGNLLDKESEVYKLSRDARSYKILDADINTQPAISYLARVRNEAVS